MAFGRVLGAMDSGINPWHLENFEESLDQWISLESPDDDLRRVKCTSLASLRMPL